MSGPITRDNLSLELKVGVALLEGPATLTELAARMGIGKRMVGRGLDMLFDQGQVKDGWAERNGWHCREAMLCDVARPFFEKVRDHLSEVQP